MLKDQNIICISSIDWDFIWQGHQEIMSSFARNGNKVLFIENTGVRAPRIRDIPRIKKRIKNWLKGVKGIREEKENLYIFSPLVLPFPYCQIARWLNQHLILSILNKWMRVMDFGDPIIWSFLPTPLSLDIADNLIRKLVIYYCIDNFSVSSLSAKKIRRSEERLLKKADLVFVTSSELYNYCSKYNAKVYNFPFAVNFTEFEKIRLKDDAISEELKDIKPPIVGYIGGVHKWIDQKLIKEIAENNSKYSFVFVGPLQTNVSLLLPLKNIHFLGKKEHEKLPLFIKHFDACIIPYRITDYTENVYPTKLNEYLALGKAVISTSLVEVKIFNNKYGDIVYIAEDKEEFDRYLNKAITEDSQLLRNKRISVARRNSWEERIEEMCDLIEETMKRNKIDKEARWKENLINFYRLTRRRILSFAISCVFLYLLLFKTPFIWFLASPLNISETPQKADAIVVFGGGVGETGSPGKSTIERARHAVKLYKDGYASNIIFSSGYTYIYNDAENMRLFAISMGIPEENIILEQEANSTYENVRFSKDIIDRNGWDSVLIISSPYNMRRVSLVFNKWGNDIKVRYTPVEEAQFYDKIYGRRLEQIRAILHEYLGIVYYWFKGYI